MDVSERRRAAFLSSFDFPLNVYVAALELEHGQLPDSLHYGLWDSATSLVDAQQAATTLMFEHLNPPCRILEAGVGLATTAQTLVGKGYDYVGVCPDAGQIANARDQLKGTSARFELAKFEDFDQQEPFDCVLFQESAQYINGLQLLPRARVQLESGGQLLMIDEFETAWAAQLPSIAANEGFGLQTHIDLTERAMPSVSYLHDVIARHYEPLLSKLRLRRPVLHEFCNELRQRWEDYNSGSHRYCLFDFRAV